MTKPTRVSKQAKLRSTKAKVFRLIDDVQTTINELRERLTMLFDMVDTVKEVNETHGPESLSELGIYEEIPTIRAQTKKGRALVPDYLLKVGIYEDISLS